MADSFRVIGFGVGTGPTWVTRAPRASHGRQRLAFETRGTPRPAVEMYETLSAIPNVDRGNGIAAAAIGTPTTRRSTSASARVPPANASNSHTRAARPHDRSGLGDDRLTTGHRARADSRSCHRARDLDRLQRPVAWPRTALAQTASTAPARARGRIEDRLRLAHEVRLDQRLPTWPCAAGQNVFAMPRLR